jgi:hypothetical protein
VSTWSDRGLSVITFGVDENGAYAVEDQAGSAREAPIPLPGGLRDLVRDGLSWSPHDLEKTLYSVVGPAFSGPLSAEFARNLAAARSTALWLDFKSPAEMLPALPWEPVLQDLFGIPVFRLPRHEILPFADTRSLSAALYLDLDATDTMADLLNELIPVIEASGERTTVNVIGPQETIYWYISEAGVSPARGSAGRAHARSVRILEPQEPWSTQIELVQPAAPVDLLIVAAPVVMSRQVPGLLVSCDADGKRRVVPPAEIAACATTLGAWSIALLSPGGEVRMLAHELAAARPGPVIAASSPVGIRDMYRRLLIGEGDPRAMAGAATAYVHPHGASTSAPIVDHSAHDQLPQIRSVLNEFTLGELAAANDAPRWLASNQRVLEQFADPLMRPPPEDEMAAERREGYAVGMTDVSSALADAYEHGEAEA